MSKIVMAVLFDQSIAMTFRFKMLASVLLCHDQFILVNVTYFNFHKAAFFNEYLECCKSLYFSSIKEVLVTVFIYIYTYVMLLNWKTNN